MNSLKINKTENVRTTKNKITNGTFIMTYEVYQETLLDSDITRYELYYVINNTGVKMKEK